MPHLDNLKQLREETGISMIECKKALDEAKGDLKRAKEILREKGREMVKGRERRKAEKGLITSYIHANNQLGVLLELNCESDFVAKSDDFKQLAHEISLQIAASRPLFISSENIPEEILNSEEKIYQKQMADSGKPAQILNKIITGKLAKYQKEVSLLSQPWIKDEQKTIKQLIDQVKAKTGENIKVGRFARFEM